MLLTPKSAPAGGAEMRDSRELHVALRDLRLPFLAGPALGVAVLSLAPATPAHRYLFVAVVAATLALGLALVAGWIPSRRSAPSVVMAAGTISISIALLAAGPQATWGAVFYLWLIPYAFLHLGGRRAWSIATLAAVGFGAVVTISPPPTGSVPSSTGIWVWVASTVAVTGLVLARMRSRLLAGEGRFDTSFLSSATPTMIVDGQGQIVRANPELETMLGTGAAEAGRHLVDLVAPESEATVRAELAATPGVISRSRRWNVEAESGERLVCRAAMSPLSPDSSLRVVQLENMTAQVEAEQQARALARDNQLILDCAGDGICRIDTDGRIVYANPAAGHLLGCPASDLVGRNAFETLLRSPGAKGVDEGRAGPLREAVRAGAVSRVTDGLFWRMDGTAFPVDYTSAPLRDSGTIVGAVCVFADISDRSALQLERSRRASTAEYVDSALREQRLLAYAQPIISIETRETVFAELLVRMRSRDLSQVIAPSAFLPDAERYGMVQKIDSWMVDQAVRQARAGRRVTLNVSTESLQGSEYLARVRRAIHESGIDPSALVFEITETAAVDQLELAKCFATKLTELGCALALDDFGTGYGAFSYLRDFPAQYLKIDREFVRNVLVSESDRRIVNTIVQMAADFGQQTIAEGVEDPATLAALGDIGVDYAQGFLIGPPRAV